MNVIVSLISVVCQSDWQCWVEPVKNISTTPVSVDRQHPGNTFSGISDLLEAYEHRRSSLDPADVEALSTFMASVGNEAAWE